MKKLLSLILLLSAAISAIAQEPTNESNDPQDTVKIKWGDSRILILKDQDKQKDSTDKKSEPASKKKFVHWGGLDLGICGLTTFDNKVRIAEDDDTTNMNYFLDLNYSKSWHVSLNFFEKGFRLYRNNIMLATGLGLEWSSYNFNKNITLNPEASAIAASNTTLAPDSVNYIKNKLKATYVKLPLMLQLNTNNEKPDRSFHIAGGIEAAVRVGSKMKQKLEEDGDVIKIKHRDDYHLAPFRLAYVLRVGYGNYFTMFANYSLTELFVVKKGPHVYPVSAGITIALN